jgi:hypothetical protein
LCRGLIRSVSQGDAAYRIAEQGACGCTDIFALEGLGAGKQRQGDSILCGAQPKGFFREKPIDLGASALQGIDDLIDGKVDLRVLRIIVQK